MSNFEKAMLSNELGKVFDYIKENVTDEFERIPMLRVLSRAMREMTEQAGGVFGDVEIK